MTTPPPSARPVVDTLMATLRQESDALDTLAGAIDFQFEALRAREHERLQDGADRASAALTELARLRQVRERQARLLGRVLGVEAEPKDGLRPLVAALIERDPEQGAALSTLRVNLRARAADTDARGKELAFALDMAINVGRELLQTWQHVDAPAPMQSYTAAGRTAAAAPRSFVNHVG